MGIQYKPDSQISLNRDRGPYLSVDGSGYVLLKVITTFKLSHGHDGRRQLELDA